MQVFSLVQTFTPVARFDPCMCLVRPVQREGRQVWPAVRNRREASSSVKTESAGAAATAAVSTLVPEERLRSVMKSMTLLRSRPWTLSMRPDPNGR